MNETRVFTSDGRATLRTRSGKRAGERHNAAARSLFSRPLPHSVVKAPAAAARHQRAVPTATRPVRTLTLSSHTYFLPVPRVSLVQNVTEPRVRPAAPSLPVYHYHRVGSARCARARRRAYVRAQ